MEVAWPIYVGVEVIIFSISLSLSLSLYIYIYIYIYITEYQGPGRSGPHRFLGTRCTRTVPHPSGPQRFLALGLPGWCPTHLARTGFWHWLYQDSGPPIWPAGVFWHWLYQDGAPGIYRSKSILGGALCGPVPVFLRRIAASMPTGVNSGANGCDMGAIGSCMAAGTTPMGAKELSHDPF